MGRGRRAFLAAMLCFFLFLLVRGLDIAYPTGAFLKDTGGLEPGGLDYAPGEVLVRFRRDPGLREAHILERIFLGAPRVVGNDAGTNAVNGRAGIRGFERVFREGDIYRLDFLENSDIEAVISEYRDLLEVVYAEPNYIYGIDATIPDDTSYYSQWNLNQTSDNDIDAPEAWDIELGDSGIIIAVVDTGVDWDHPDLSGNIWNNTDEIPDNGLDDDGNGYADDARGYDFVDSASLCASGEDCDTEDNDPMDFHGHGTHVSGIAAAATNNSIGIAGVCWNCTIMAVRAGYKNSLGGGSLRVADIAQAVGYAADNGAHVISMSFGGSHSSTMQDAMDYAYGKGVVLVGSAGNDNTNAKSYPAAYSNVISVSSTTDSDAKSSFSNYGPWVDVAAPGSSIYSTYYDDAYSAKSGTSMAAPHVAGLAGLMLSHNPSLSQGQVRSIIRTSVDVIVFSAYMGSGRINAHKALQINSSPVAALDQAMGDSGLAGTVQVNGSAEGPGFLNYSLWYGSGLYPSSWSLISGSTQEASGGNLTDWGTGGLADGEYTLRLSVLGTGNQEANETLPVTLDNPQNPPSFSGYAVNATPNETQDAELNVTVTDDYWIDTVTIEVTNQRTSSTINYTVGTNVSGEWYFILGSGNYSVNDNVTWFWYANDTAGNLNHSPQQGFRVADAVFPSLSGYAISITPDEDQDAELNATITDNHMVDSVILEITNNTHTVNYTVVTNVSSEWYFVLGHGNYTAHDNVTWFWYANDSSNNLNASGQQGFIVANRVPSVPEHSSPVSSYNSSSNMVSLEWGESSDNDTEDDVTYYLYINDILNSSTASASLDVGFPEGQFHWNLAAGDGHGNSSRSPEWSFTVDTTPISSVSYLEPTPGNASPQNRSYIYVNASLSENPAACLLEWDDGTPANESMAIEGSLCYRNMTGLSAYNYSFSVYGSDSAGNWNSSAPRTVDVSTGAPAVSIISPGDNSWGGSSVTFLYSATGEGLDSCSLYLNISGWGANQSDAGPVSGGQGSFAASLPDGGYIWNIICSSSTGSGWYPSNLSLNIDTIPPVITLASPGNRTYSWSPELNFSYLELNPGSCWRWNGSGNTTLASCDANGTAIPGDEGQNPLVLYMNDSGGNAGSGSVYWSLDTAKPQIALISPENASSWTSSGTVTFRYNVSDAGIANCSLIVGGSLDQTRASVPANSTQEFSMSLSNGNYLWQVNCTDLGGLENSSAGWDLTVSHTPPAQDAGNGGGGGGLTAEETPAPPAGSSKSWSVIDPGTDTGMDVEGGGAIGGIEFSTRERVSGAELSLESLAGAPAGTGSPEGEVYQFLEISHKNLEEEKLEALRIGFSVNMSWISGNMIDISTISLNRHSGGAWKRLPTLPSGRDAEQANFTAESPGFSYFAVTGERLLAVHVCGPGERRCLGDELQACGDGISWIGIENCSLGCNESLTECNPGPREAAGEPPGAGIPYVPHAGPEGGTAGDYAMYAVLAALLIIISASSIYIHRRGK